MQTKMPKTGAKAVVFGILRLMVSCVSALFFSAETVDFPEPSHGKLVRRIHDQAIQIKN